MQSVSKSAPPSAFRPRRSHHSGRGFIARSAISGCVHEARSVVEQLQSGVRCRSSSHRLLSVKCSRVWYLKSLPPRPASTRAAVHLLCQLVSRFCQHFVPALTLIHADDPLISKRHPQTSAPLFYCPGVLLNSVYIEEACIIFQGIKKEPNVRTD